MTIDGEPNEPEATSGKPDAAALERSARILATFLEENRITCILPYANAPLFPKNCCQSASLILLYLLEEKYGQQDVELIKGSNYQTDESHYWVRAGGLVYDLTAHQFSGLTPVFGVPEGSYLRGLFPESEVDPERTWLDRSEVCRLYQAQCIPF
ncbi:hypothetical protein [Ensifer adhaerens]|uniref:hypothetical protein n=1 Tax=Ensifer adhaerens TaxID=106592 RepID=UPI000DC399AF|nr:hypothetical protein [Ensifer adhaerens]RAR98618.1 hypothetical protein DEU52_1653 [Ensifer adhaerens]